MSKRVQHKISRGGKQGEYVTMKCYLCSSGPLQTSIASHRLGVNSTGNGQIVCAQVQFPWTSQYAEHVKVYKAAHRQNGCCSPMVTEVETP